MALKTTIVKAGSSSQDDFPKFLQTLLNGRTTNYKTVKTADNALVHHQVILDATKHLEILVGQKQVEDIRFLKVCVSYNVKMWHGHFLNRSY